MSDLKTNLESILEEKQSKIIPENIKKDTQIFDVVGTYTGDGQVKLFETEEEMQADAKAKEGDLAIVYKNEINNVTADSKFQYLTFPETVTLPAAVTTDSFCMLEAVDSSSSYFNGQIMLNASSFEFSGWSDIGSIRVSYTSSDGINYTRDTAITNPVDLGTEVLIYDANSFIANMGYFMQINVDTFKGLYEYSSYIDKDNVYSVLVSDMTFDYNSTDGITNMAWNGNKYSILNVPSILELYTKIKEDTGLDLMYVAIDENDNLILFDLKNYNYMCGDIAFDPNKNQLGICSPNENDYDFILSVATLNLESKTYTLNEYNSSGEVYVNVYKYNWSYFPIKLKTLTYSLNSSGRNKITCNNYFVVGDMTTGYRKNYSGNSPLIPESLDGLFVVKYKYMLASTQFNLTASNELLPGKTAYGKNGPVTGDDTLYDNLDAVKILTKYFGISENAAELSYRSILSKAKEASSLPEDGCIPYINVTDFDKFNMYHLTDFNSKENLIYLMNWKQHTIQKLQDNSSYLEKYDYTTNKILCVGYGGSSTATQPIEVYVYNDSIVQLDHYLTTTSYPSINATNMFYYNDELYVPQDTRNSTLYKFNESKNGLVEVKSDLGGFLEGLALDIDLNVVYLCIGLTTNGYFITERIIKTLDLSTNTLTTIDNNDVECFAESEHYIGYFLKDINIFKYKKKGSIDFKSVSIDVGEYNVLELTLGENSDDTKLAVALECADSSYTGGSLGVIDLASNTYTQYKTDYHNEAEFGYLLNNDIYLIDRLGYVYITSNDGVTTSLSSEIYPYYFNVLNDASFDVRGTTNTYGAPSSIFTCEYTPYNFELGLSDTSMNFFAKDNKTMFVVGNYNTGVLT